MAPIPSRAFAAAVVDMETLLKRKADVSEHPWIFVHAGLLVNRPSGSAGLPFF
jgi:hypothetical protein